MNVARSRGVGAVAERLGERADDPATAATVVAATAVAFSTAWFGYMVGQGSMWTDGQGGVAVLFVATVANAYLVTYVLWRVFVPAGTWGYRRALQVGATVGLVSHVTVGFAWVLAGTGTGVLTGTVPSPGEAVMVGAVLSAWSVPFTLGVPILLSVASALGLTYCRKLVARESREEVAAA